MTATSAQRHRCREFSYRLKAPVQPDRATVEFEGRFEQRPVRWLATIVRIGADRPNAVGGGRSFIDIDAHGPDEDGTLHVQVGLQVAEIDPPTICKTIIMLRNYKRLRRGRMEFG